MDPQHNGHAAPPSGGQFQDVFYTYILNYQWNWTSTACSDNLDNVPFRQVFLLLCVILFPCSLMIPRISFQINYRI